MLVNVYWNKKTGAVLVPAVAKTEAGFWLDTEPVEVADATFPVSVSEAIKKSAARARIIVPTPPRSSPKPVVLGYANVKSWSAFAKTHELLSIVRTDAGQYLVNPHRRLEGGGYVVKANGGKQLPAGSTLDDAIARLVSLMMCDD